MKVLVSISNARRLVYAAETVFRAFAFRAMIRERSAIAGV